MRFIPTPANTGVFIYRKMKPVYCSLFFLVLLSCTVKSGKKVLVMGRGKITVSDTVVNMNNGTGYIEQEIDLDDRWTSLLIKTPSGNNSVAIPVEKGAYLLNLKTDTIVGSYQEFGTDLNSSRVLTQEDLVLKIDSLEALTRGDNINYINNYFCLPGQFLKVSPNKNAFIFGPYKSIPGRFVSDNDFSEPEIYKFYTNAEMRRLISNFKAVCIYYKNEQLVED